MENSDTAEVIIGARLWEVPMLAAKQNKIIDPLILGLLPIFAQWNKDKAGALAKIGRPQYEALQEIAFVAIMPLAPDLTRERFLELPITLPELITAFNVIARQTGIFQQENASGEAVGA